MGLSSARSLLEHGAKVTVVEMHTVGKGCSFGNAGWLTPCFALPLPQPGLFWSSIQWLLDSESPLYIQPRMSLTLMQWLYRFLKSMNQEHLNSSTESLVQLSNLTLDLIGKMNLTPIADFKKNGLLMVSATDKGLKSTLDEMHLVARYGVKGQQLSSSEIQKMEPSLVGPLSGGVYFPNEAQIEPYQLCLALKEEVEAKGGVILQETEVTDLKIKTVKELKIIESLQTSSGGKQTILSGDAYVLATGSWSEMLGQTLGLKIPVLGGKGYSMLIPSYPEQPKYPIMILERKIAITPRADGVRLAGTLELVRNDHSINPKRSAAIFNGSRSFVRLPSDATMGKVWSGLRPCTPDGLPIIGRSDAVQNLWFNTGHQMLGLQTSLGSGELLKNIMLKKSAGPAAIQMSPRRFRL